jgi:hypothetical protein
MGLYNIVTGQNIYGVICRKEVVPYGPGVVTLRYKIITSEIVLGHERDAASVTTSS